ncbi:MAG TPA: hypothetical protein VKT32_16235 [Chthonomonadaceae bacterium]|nr:hypothetical protein [Chthonomonadaceae bacterium]
MAQQQIIKGTWDEIAAHADELRDRGELTLIVPARPDKEAAAQNGKEQDALHQKLAAIIAEAESLESEPGKPLRDPLEAEWGKAVEEKYRKMGFMF